MPALAASSPAGKKASAAAAAAGQLAPSGQIALRRLQRELANMPLDPELTPNEQARLRVFAREFLSNCMHTAQSAQQDVVRNFNNRRILQIWAQEALNNSEYCRCGLRKLLDHAKTLLRSSAHADAEALGDAIAGECAMSRAKNAFMRYCPQIISSDAPKDWGKARTKQFEQTMCNCLKPEIAVLEASEFLSYFDSSEVDDFEVYAVTGDLQSLPPGKRLYKSALHCALGVPQAGASEAASAPAALPADSTARTGSALEASSATSVPASAISATTPANSPRPAVSASSSVK